MASKIGFGALFLAIITAVMLVLLELGSFAYLYYVNQRWDARSDIQVTLDSTTKDGADVVKLGVSVQPEYRQHILHPYLGFVRNFAVKRQVFNERVVEVPLNDYGFFGASPLTEQNDGDFIIAITGGSVALEFYLDSGNSLLSELISNDFGKGRNIRLISLALDGMKQPQQLIALNYFLTLGAHYDMVINLDGFNEVALPNFDNVRLGVNPFFPRGWVLYSLKAVDARFTRIATELLTIRSDIEYWRSVFSKPVLRHSNLLLAYWQQYHKRQENQMRRLENRLYRKQLGMTKRSQQEKGPAYTKTSLSDVIRDSVDVWKRASVQMWRICQANDIIYHHFLQPNQYHKGSKQLTVWESEFAFSSTGDGYRQGAEYGYPLLVDTGDELRDSGMPFTDLTQIFKDETGSIYRDNCCHYNSDGNEIIARKIAAVISASQ